MLKKRKQYPAEYQSSSWPAHDCPATTNDEIWANRIETLPIHGDTNVTTVAHECA